MKNDKGILIDSDIIIWFLRGKEEFVKNLSDLIRTSQVFVSPISIAEIYAGAKKKEENIIKEFFELLQVIEISNETAKAAGNFIQNYRKSHSVELADALIGATAKVNDLLLWTLNKKHYPMLKKSNFYH